MAKLKPCPFCGGKGHVMKMGFPHWVYCEDCGARVQGGTCEEKDSIKAWNRRTGSNEEKKNYHYGEWISVDEDLPEDGTWNLWTDGKSISIERYKMDALDHFEPGGRFFELEDAVAWMPIPETLWNEAHKFVQKK